MLDYNAKFDRREAATVFDEEEIRELVSSRLNPSEIESASLLTGGFMNSNFRLKLRDNASLVLRISARSADLKKELSVLKKMHGGVPVPTVVAEDFTGPHPFALIEFIEGTLFSDALRSVATEELIKLAAKAGAVLQTIHSFDLGKAGFFDEHFAFNPVFENFGASLCEYICSSLEGSRVRERLGERLAERALQCVQSKREIYSSIPNSTRLIHCDYNLKNILIRKAGSAWKVAGVLDWEFAISGSPLVDIGNFLRFEDELPPGFSESFIRGYGLISLPSNWREVARLLDLAAMVNFLEGKEEAPKTFRTAMSVIEKTVESVGRGSRKAERVIRGIG